MKIYSIIKIQLQARLITSKWLDVSFREDQSRIRKNNASEEMATLRKIALQALKKIKDSRVLRAEGKWQDGIMSISFKPFKKCIFKCD
jgi:hypothetical protein